MKRLLLSLLMVSPVLTWGQNPKAEMQDCLIGGLKARCGRLMVWENRAKHSGKKIPISFVVIKATAANPQPDAIFTLSGGPGVASVATAAEVAPVFGFYLKHRDFVLMDSRGIGGSNDLNCGDPPPNAPVQELMVSLRQRAKQCLTELKGKGDLTQYHAMNIIDDVDELRAALGYGKINLHGLSYGTRLEQLYARKYPQHVRSITMEGPVALAEFIPAELPADSQKALNDLLNECMADAACHAAFPNVHDEFSSALAGLRQHPHKAEIENPRTHKPETLAIDYPMAAQAIRAQLVTAIGASAVPLLIHQTANDDWAPMAKAVLGSRIGEPNFSYGMWLSATCSEDFPFTPKSKYAALPQYYFPNNRILDQKAACDMWPKAKLPSSMHKPLETDIPILILVGQMDGITPMRMAREIAEHARNTTIVEIPDGGHLLVGLQHPECMDKIEGGFIERGNAEGLDTSCLKEMKRFPFATEKKQPSGN